MAVVQPGLRRTSSRVMPTAAYAGERSAQRAGGPPITLIHRRRPRHRDRVRGRGETTPKRKAPRADVHAGSARSAPSGNAAKTLLPIPRHHPGSAERSSTGSTGTSQPFKIDAYTPAIGWSRGHRPLECLPAFAKARASLRATSIRRRPYPDRKGPRGAALTSFATSAAEDRHLDSPPTRPQSWGAALQGIRSPRAGGAQGTGGRAEQKSARDTSELGLPQ